MTIRSDLKAASTLVRLALAGVLAAPPLALAQIAPPALDLFNVPNYANSPQPTIVTMGTCSVTTSVQCIADSDCPNSTAGAETCQGLVVSGGLRKFTDALPGLCEVSGAAPTTGQCLPLAVPDTTTYPGSDYYVIGLKDYTMQFHSDLPATTQVRGYYQKNAPAAAAAGVPHYLGPLILAQRDRPVRFLFVNELPNASDPATGPGAKGDLFVPTDTNIPGAGEGPIVNPDTGLPIAFTQNRATIHLHGGNTQWISDGFQHQWTAPAGEFTAAQYPNVSQVDLAQYKKGLSTAYVPDMWFDAAGNTVTQCAGQATCAVAGASNNPGDGMMTFYYPNQQSGRLLFYHDHAYGTTRLNVYAGEAAGYLLVDKKDEDALAAAGVPGTIGTGAASGGTDPDLAHVLPLVFQDRTFVPTPAELAAQDPTWDSAKWGGYGNFWYPHVYTPNQWPDAPDLSGSNPMGRWDYGPWFWPPQTTLTASPSPGQLTVPCQTMWGVPAGQPPMNTSCPITPNPSLVPESFLDTVVVNGTPYPTITVDPVAYRFQILNASQERAMNLSFFVADATGKDVVMAPALPHVGGRSVLGAIGTALPALCPATAPISQVTGLPVGPDLPGVSCWPQKWPTDARAGGVPDPAYAGPAIVQIGSEGGILPAPAIIPPQPVDYEYNRRNIVVLNVSSKALFLGSAERADVVVDFSMYAGKTLILYNDAPAPVPAGDSRNDYYTGDPDQTSTGGARETVPGYGPNTRTLVQVVVNPSVQNPAAVVTPTGWIAEKLSGPSATLKPAVTQIFKTKQPAVIVPEAAYSDVAGTTLPNTYLPIQAMSLTFTPVNNPAAGAITVPFGNKALHELFDTDFGRMNSVLGVEIPNTTWLNQTTIPFTNQDPTTEWIQNDKPQIWKVTHNGVDTHAIHFHLLNAQVINRVGWDGAIRPPDPNELGWKDTVRMNPLEDIIIALQPVKQTLPWPLPDSIRPMDVITPVGSPSPLFTGVNVLNNPYAPPLVNSLQNFGWEYVWHCHLLGHEENDMLRPEVFIVPPETPTGLTASWVAGPSVAATFVDQSLSEYGFTVQRADDAGFTVNVKSMDLPPNAGYSGTVSFADAAVGDPATAVYFYRAQAYKTFTDIAAPPPNNLPYNVTSSWSNVAMVGAPPIAALTPTSLAFGSVLLGTVSAPQVITLSNTGAQPLTVGSVVLSGAAGQFAMVNGCAGAIAPLGTCTVSVTFGPTAMGPAAGTVTFSTTDPVNPVQVVALSGTGVAPVAAIAPAALAFGAQLVGAASPAQVATISNTGTADLVISGIGVTGANPADFAQVSTCGATLAAGASCTIGVTFTPAAVGASSATLTVAVAAPATALTVALSGTGAVPVASVSPATLTFANQLTGTTSAAQVVTLSNTGGWPLTVTGLALGGANAAEFAETTTCGATLAAASSCTISVTFAPVTQGPKAAALTITGNDPVTPTLTVAITGAAIGQSIAVTPASLAFGAQLIGTASAGQVVTLSNGGAWPLSLTSVALAGANAAEFAQASTCGATLAAGASCTVTVSFTPASAGAKAAALTVSSSDPVTPTVSVALSGTGVGPIGAIAPASLAFGAQLVGAASPAQVATVSNTGTADLVVTGVTVTGANAADFAQVTTCGATVAPGASCTVSVTFTPAAVGARSATLTVAVAAPATALTVALSGTGAVPVAQVAPTSVAFGNQLTGTTSAAQVVTLTNPGGWPLAVGAPALGGANAAEFAQTTTCGATLAAGASCTFAVTFAPATTGAKAAALAFTTSDATTPTVTVALSGTGVAPALSLTPAALGFAAQLVGATTAAQAVTVANTGTADLAITGISVSGANAGDFARSGTCGATVAPGASCTVSVTFTPGATGPRAATLSVNVAAPATSGAVALTGTGAAPAVGVAPAALAFGAQLVGTTSAPQVVTVTNGGTWPLALSGIALGGASAAEFGLASACGASLAPGASCTAAVAFSPASAGAKAAALTVASSDPANPLLTEAITASGVAPVAVVTPGSLPFGLQLVGAASAAQVVTISNAGTADLVLAGLAVSGANAGDFVATSGCGATVAPGASCTISVAFTPAAVGARAASLDVAVAAPASGAAVALTGTGAVPVVGVTPASLTFATQLVNTVSAAQTVTVANTGAWPATLGSVGLTGASAGDFGLTTTCGATLAAGGACTASITYQAKVAGTSTAALAVSSSDPATPTSTVALSGTATALAASTSSLAFGNVLVGRTSTATAVTITNDGAAALALGAITTSNAQFVVSNTTCGASLGATRSCTVSVQFAPGAVGPQAGLLSIASADPMSPLVVALSGNGVAPVLAVSPLALTFTSNVGVRTAAQTVTVSNTGTAPLAISSIRLTGTANQYAMTNNCPATLAINGSCTVSITFRPTSPGLKAAGLAVNVAAPATSATVALNGTGNGPILATSATALAFGTQAVGTTSAPQVLTVSNAGNQAMTINAISLQGGNATQFAITGNACPASLGAGASCDVSVVFKPTAAGAFSSGVRISVAAPAVSRTVAVSGTGQ